MFSEKVNLTKDSCLMEKDRNPDKIRSNQHDFSLANLRGVLAERIAVDADRCSYMQTLLTLMSEKSPDIALHSVRVANLSYEIANFMGLDESICQDVYCAAKLHDVGKLGISTDLLWKKSPLVMSEALQVQQHSVLGWRILKDIPVLRSIAYDVLHHHERVDGRGYPSSLKTPQIPLSSRIISVADAFDAMIAERPYSKPLPLQKAFIKIVRAEGSQFDMDVVSILAEICYRTPSFFRGRYHRDK